MSLVVTAKNEGLKGQTHEFDGNLLVVEQVRPFKDDAERSLSDLLPHPIVHPDNVGR